jgi:hypothetical protein
MEKATNRVLASRGVSILVKRKFNIGDIKLATGMNTGRFIALTLFLDKDGSGKDPTTLRIGAAYYDCDHNVTLDRRVLSEMIRTDSESNGADETIYHTDANCPYKLSDCAIMEDEKYVQQATMENGRKSKMENLRHATGGERTLSRLGEYEAYANATFQHPNVHSEDGQEHIRRGKTTTAYIIDHTFYTAPSECKYVQIDVSTHDRAATDHGIHIGYLDMKSTGVTVETEDKEYVDVAPITYHIDTDRHKCGKLLRLTNDWITKNAKMDTAYKVMSVQSNEQTAATPQEVLTCVEDAEQACKIMGKMAFEPRSKGKRRPLVNKAI